MSNEDLAFTCSNGEVETIRDGRVVWSKRILGFPAKEVLQLAGDRALVMLGGHVRYGPFENLICIDDRGEVVWRTAFEGSQANEFTMMRLEGGKVMAYASAGWVYTIDVLSGRVLRKDFTK